MVIYNKIKNMLLPLFPVTTINKNSINIHNIYIELYNYNFSQNITN